MSKPTLPNCENTWEIREEPERCGKAVVVKVREVRDCPLPVEARFLEAYLDRVSSSGPKWTWEPRILDKPDRFGFFVRATDLAVELSCLPFRMVYAAYTYPEGALYMMTLRAYLEGNRRFQVRCPFDPTAADPAVRAPVERVLAASTVSITFLEGDLTPVMTREARQGPDAAAAAQRLWNQARHHAITTAHDYEKALARFRKENAGA